MTLRVRIPVKFLFIFLILVILNFLCIVAFECYVYPVFDPTLLYNGLTVSTKMPLGARELNAANHLRLEYSFSTLGTAGLQFEVLSQELHSKSLSLGLSRDAQNCLLP